jgi:hypothetical protein
MGPARLTHGVDKTFLANALGHLACRQRYLALAGSSVPRIDPPQLVLIVRRRVVAGVDQGAGAM